VLIFLHGHEVIDLLRQLAAQHRAAARLHSILFVPRLAVHLAAQRNEGARETVQEGA
jgi:DNA-binding FrmR family transcriptional regulator